MFMKLTMAPPVAALQVLQAQLFGGINISGQFHQQIVHMTNMA